MNVELEKTLIAHFLRQTLGLANTCTESTLLGYHHAHGEEAVRAMAAYIAHAPRDLSQKQSMVAFDLCEQNWRGDTTPKTLIWYRAQQRPFSAAVH